jgi:hypothetical protein
LFTLITMVFSSEERFNAGASLEKSYGDDGQDPSTIYDASGPLLGAWSSPKVLSRDSKSLKNRLKNNISTILLTIFFVFIVLESIYIVEFQRRANARFLGPSMPVTPTNIFRFH